MAAPILTISRNLFFLILIMTIFFILVNDWMKHNHPMPPEKMKYILYWNKFFGGYTNMTMGFGESIFEDCPVKSCYATNDPTLKPVEEFDAIIFHGPTLNFQTDVKAPETRNFFQKYIYFSWEAPIKFPVSRYSKNFYNWTMTYRTDSDIYAPYFLIEKQETNYVMPNSEYFKNKTKMAAWFVSNCNSIGTRVRKNYVNELQKYISIDIYGECGNLSCPRSKTDECNRMLETNYKFYLAFENAMCKDYVTEKMFKTLRLNIIPIVLGKVDYNTAAPPHSVINVADFDSPKLLAQYLVQLSEDPEEYLKYFEWKKDFIISKPAKFMACQICKKLHEPLDYFVYEDLKFWSMGINGSLCSLSNVNRTEATPVG